MSVEINAMDTVSMEEKDEEKNSEEKKEEIAKNGTDKKKEKAKDHRTRPPKDINAPKRPASAYFLFSAEERRKLKEQHPKKKVTELVQMASAKWKNLNSEEKKTIRRKSQ